MYKSIVWVLSPTLICTRSETLGLTLSSALTESVVDTFGSIVATIAKTSDRLITLVFDFFIFPLLFFSHIFSYVFVITLYSFRLFSAIGINRELLHRKLVNITIFLFFIKKNCFSGTCGLRYF